MYIHADCTYVQYNIVQHDATHIEHTGYLCHVHDLVHAVPASLLGGRHWSDAVETCFYPIRLYVCTYAHTCMLTSMHKYYDVYMCTFVHSVAPKTNFQSLTHHVYTQCKRRVFSLSYHRARCMHGVCPLLAGWVTNGRDVYMVCVAWLQAGSLVHNVCRRHTTKALSSDYADHTNMNMHTYILKEMAALGVEVEACL